MVPESGTNKDAHDLLKVSHWDVAGERAIECRGSTTSYCDRAGAGCPWCDTNAGLQRVKNVPSVSPCERAASVTSWHAAQHGRSSTIIRFVRTSEVGDLLRACRLVDGDPGTSVTPTDDGAMYEARSKRH